MVRKHASRALFVTALLAAAAGMVPPQVAVADDPSIEFTYVPPHGSNENLQGRVRGVNPGSCSVAVYIFGDGFAWWTKPYQASPKVPIQPDSTWTCDITTGGSDRFAIRVRAYLWPNSLGTPPFANGTETLWSWMDTLPHCDTIRPTRRVIVFRGDTWYVKASDTPVGPGPNYFSDSTANVWLDATGQMHLRITHRGGIWWCSEVYRKRSRGYGPHIFAVTGPIGRFDPNAVLGLFSWDNWPVPPYLRNLHREIDIEFSRWGIPGDTNAQYVVQPYTISGNRHRWWFPPDIDSSTHSFNWQHDSIRFLGVKGHQFAPPYDSTIHTWFYSGQDIPVPGTETPRVNLWLFNGHAPTDTQEVEVVVARFETSYAVVDLPAREPTPLLLEQLHQNPVRNSALIGFTLPGPAHVVLKVYDIFAREKGVLVNGRLPAGRHEVRWRGHGLPSGVYLYRLQAGGFNECGRLTLLE